MSEPLPETNLVKLAEREVVEAAKAWANTFYRKHVTLVERYTAQHALLEALSLLESREEIDRQAEESK